MAPITTTVVGMILVHGERETLFVTHLHPWAEREDLPIPISHVDRIIVQEDLVFTVEAVGTTEDAKWFVREYQKKDVRRFDYITKDLKEMFP